MVNTTCTESQLTSNPHTVEIQDDAATTQDVMSKTVGSEVLSKDAESQDLSPTRTDSQTAILSGGWHPTAEDKLIEKRIKLKTDLITLPILTIVYLFNALDKGNLGNAKTDTLEKDLGLYGQQYYYLTTIFYVPFCLCGIPLMLLVKRYSAARVVPVLMFCFGACSLLQAAVSDFAGLFVLRMLLGVFESPMLPAVVFYLSTFYTRGELARRIGVFYSAAAISGAFSGLIAYGVFQLSHPSISGWRILFIIEGAITVILSVGAWLVLPRDPQTARFLSGVEKLVARRRIESDSSVSVSETLKIRDAFRPFTDWRYSVWALISFTFGIPLVSINTFLPQIVARLGYGTVKTNLFTIAPNVASAVFLVCMCVSSDRFRERGFHICFSLIVGLAGWIALTQVSVENVGATYGATFLAAMGATTPSVLTATWYSNNTASESRRAVLAAVMIAIANSAGLVSTNIFRKEWEPQYIPSLAISAGGAGICLVITFLWAVYMRWDNARRDKRQGVIGKRRAQDVSTSILEQGWKSPDFRWSL